MISIQYKYRFNSVGVANFWLAGGGASYISAGCDLRNSSQRDQGLGFFLLKKWLDLSWGHSSWVGNGATNLRFKKAFLSTEFQATLIFRLLNFELFKNCNHLFLFSLNFIFLLWTLNEVQLVQLYHKTAPTSDHKVMVITYLILRKIIMAIYEACNLQFSNTFVVLSELQWKIYNGPNWKLWFVSRSFETLPWFDRSTSEDL